MTFSNLFADGFSNLFAGGIVGSLIGLVLFIPLIVVVDKISSERGTTLSICSLYVAELAICSVLYLLAAVLGEVFG